MTRRSILEYVQVLRSRYLGAGPLAGPATLGVVWPGQHNWAASSILPRLHQSKEPLWSSLFRAVL